MSLLDAGHLTILSIGGLDARLRVGNDIVARIEGIIYLNMSECYH